MLEIEYEEWGCWCYAVSDLDGEPLLDNEIYCYQKIGDLQKVCSFEEIVDLNIKNKTIRLENGVYINNYDNEIIDDLKEYFEDDRIELDDYAQNYTDCKNEERQEM